MARHETVLKRIPQAKLARFEDADWSDQTVAAFQSRWAQQIKCKYCTETFDTTGLDRLLADWGPDTVISVAYGWTLEPGDPREPRVMPTELARDISSGKEWVNGPSPSPNGKSR